MPGRKAQLVVDTIDFFLPCLKKMKEIREVNPDFLSLTLLLMLFRKGESWLEVMEKSPFLREGGYSFMVAGGISAAAANNERGFSRCGSGRLSHY